MLPLTEGGLSLFITMLCVCPWVCVFVQSFVHLHKADALIIGNIYLCCPWLRKGWALMPQAQKSVQQQATCNTWEGAIMMQLVVFVIFILFCISLFLHSLFAYDMHKSVQQHVMLSMVWSNLHLWILVVKIEKEQNVQYKHFIVDCISLYLYSVFAHNVHWTLGVK